MPKLLVLILLLPAAVARADSPPAANGPQPLDAARVIARINSEVVLASEVMWEADLILSERLAQVPPEHRHEIPAEELEAVRQQLMQGHLRSLIDTKLLYSDFVRRSRGVDISKVRQQLDEPFFAGGTSGDAPGSAPFLMKAFAAESLLELEQTLHRLGTSIEDRKSAFVERAIAMQWLREQVRVDHPAQSDLVQYFQDHIADYQFPTQARWEELTVRFGNHPTKQAAMAKLVEAGNLAWDRWQQNPGETEPLFTDIAPKYSEAFNAQSGGMNDWTTEGALRDDVLDRAIFSLPVGALSPIVESQSGLHIVRVVERRDAGHTPFLEVQDEIREKIMDERYSAATKAVLDDLRRTTRIWTIYTGDTTAEAFLTPPGGPQRR